MGSAPVTASAPGSLMLFGEHGVLRGHPALVAAMEDRIRVTIQPRGDTQITIQSAIGRYASSLADLAPSHDFRFLLAVLRARSGQLTSGLDIAVRADFPSTIGFGSSAAVTVAALCALDTVLSRPSTPATLATEARTIIRAVQGAGSGADAAASVSGGIVYFEPDAGQIRTTPCPWVFTAVYAGYKRATPEVIAWVDERYRRQPEVLNAVFSAQSVCTQAAARALEEGDVFAFGELMNTAHGFHEALGVCDATLASIIHALRQDPGIAGAKISGSGLGDCAIGLGAMRGEMPHERRTVRIATDGVRLETS